jgi:type IV pilus assembly protein PilY1
MAQVSVNEDFTKATTNNVWYFFNGACLTASKAAGVEPTPGTSGQLTGQIPGCTTIALPGSYYGKNGEYLTGGYNGTFPDPSGSGALRFTNGSPFGYSENGGVIFSKPFATGAGVAITFRTVTYLGNSGGAGGDGADGISFYLMDATKLNTSTITGTSSGDGNGLGAWGGSLGYTCSNANTPFNGLIGGYLGLGIDEYGNYLNGSQWMPGYTGPNAATGDNTQLGYGYRPNRIGLRGAGNIAWNWLTANYPQYYPSSLSAAAQNAAVAATCRSGAVVDATNGNALVTTASTTGTGTSPAYPLADYAPIPNAYVELPSSTKIANESAATRGAATPIAYQLKITQNGLLSLAYAVCPPAGCGAYISVINAQDITAANGALPANFLFGFAGSTGGSTNIHEILCFNADPDTTASSSAGGGEKQSAKLQTGVQAYFAFYNPQPGWTGRVTANSLLFDTYGNIVIATTPNWDASCYLTGGNCSSTGVTGMSPQGPSNRAILTWSGSGGIPFQYSSLTAAQQAAIDAGDVATAACSATNPVYSPADRVNYLRGDPSCEISTTGVGEFRRRTDQLASIVDSSPIWVGAPNAPYSVAWSDRLNSADPLPENSSPSSSYANYASAQQNRQQVVYVGADDGFLHGFRSGPFNASASTSAGPCSSNPAPGCFTNNDGKELLAYMPGAVLQTIHQYQAVSSTNPANALAAVDFSNSQYGHTYFVDATPGAGDLYYNGGWHSWLVGGLGVGGSAIYALDVTNPGNFAESNAATLVIGEWTGATTQVTTSGTTTTTTIIPGTLTCANVAKNCDQNLGNTYGTPQIRRLHDGKWGIIFGNGYGSVTGDAGIFIGVVDPMSGTPTFYYLSTSTGSASSPNGIAYLTPADLDGDHMTDYVYAGDLQGNMWRFDLTSSSETTWAVTPGPLFKTPTGQPITTAPVVASGAPSSGMQQQLMILFGTGQKTPVTNASASTYAAGTQSLYGVWDWNMKAWNSMSSAAQYAALTPASTGLSGNNTATSANLQAQTVTINTTTQDREIAANATICWAGQSGCTGSAAKFGWYLNLPGNLEQILFNPELVAQALTVNSVVPAVLSSTSCASPNDSGFTYVLNAMTGGAFTQVFLPPSEAAAGLSTNPAYADMQAIGIQTNATGSSFITTNGAGTSYLVFETNRVNTNGSGSIQGGTLGLNLPPNTVGRRISWIERR